ncbi:AfsR/SARP family transcriptional regulator [Gordonia rhizosphera]|uniref:Putative DNA-binding protein n=1 Tax=Gordonia rhizosphera NBRC 16068 TaxID=1108045 RepID=K6V5P9_9ACTN|nr:BTAD domain-containing putative transcriptional regulator [Gordonia rhizosphera]GAB91583.1 putative DNA-binding protein [Gordonia rhizosphera NBRC 16068]
MADAEQRIYVVGTVGIAVPGRFVDERSLPGRQGRMVFAMLVLHRNQALTREAIANELWPGGRPAAWENAISALISKLRPLLELIEPKGSATVDTAFGAHRLVLPPGIWIDIECAALRLDEAEAALRDGDEARAWPAAHITWAITRRPFLPGEDSPWVAGVRRRLDGLRIRALACLSDVWSARGEYTLASTCVQEALAIDPVREDSYRRLMEIHLSEGNPAAALAVYERCRVTLDDRLGALPGSRTRALYQRVLDVT